MKNFQFSIFNFQFLPKQNGFTIVETLVAIAILMIAIAGPLVVASKGLNSALASKDQMIASYLAQESMEVIKNMRDNNLKSGGGWLDNLNTSNVCNNTAVNGYLCDASAIANNPIISQTDHKLYYNANTGYSHDSSAGSATIFSRYFYFQSVNSGEVVAHVYVDWNEGSVPYEIHLTSNMTNAERP